MLSLCLTCPSCFTNTQWQQWLGAASESGLAASSFCRDCLPIYQAYMIVHEKCACPTVVFIDSPGGVIGFHLGERMDKILESL